MGHPTLSFLMLIALSISIIVPGIVFGIYYLRPGP